MTTKQRFEAAVNVIRNLPKNGSYQPSKTLMLDFYSYYKQATEGSERGPRPSFWDVINRAKWDAWNNLGTMSSEEAMQKYIDELNKIIETMSLTDNVAEFLQSMDSYQGNPEDIELSIGPLLERVRQQPSSSPGSLNTTPSHKADISSTSSTVSDEEYDVFEDTLPEDPAREEELQSAVRRKDTPMVMPVSYQCIEPAQTSHDTRLSNGYIPQKNPHLRDPVNDALQKAVETLRRDLTTANDRVSALEERLNKALRSRKTWTGPQVTQGSVAFIVLWPIFVHYFLIWVRRRRQH